MSALLLAAALAVSVPPGWEGAVVEDGAQTAGTGRPGLDVLARQCPPPHSATELSETPHDIYVTRTEALRPVGADASDPLVTVPTGSLPGVICDGPHGWEYVVQDGATFLVSGVLDLDAAAASQWVEHDGLPAAITDPAGGAEATLRERPGDRATELARLTPGQTVTAGPAWVGPTVGMSSITGSRAEWVPVTTETGQSGWVDSRALVVSTNTDSDVWGGLETTETSVTRAVPVYVPGQRIDPAHVVAPASPGTEDRTLQPGETVVRSVGMWERPSLGWSGAAAASDRAGELPPEHRHLASLLVVVEVRPGVLGWAPAWLDAPAAALPTTTPTEAPTAAVEPAPATPTETAEPAPAPVTEPGSTTPTETGPGMRDRLAEWWAGDEHEDGPTLTVRAADATGWTAMQRTMAWLTAALVGLPGLVLLGVAWVRARRRVTGASTAGTAARAALIMTPAGLLRWAPAWPLGLALTAWGVAYLPTGVLPALVTVAGAGAAAVTSGQVLAGRSGVLLDALRPVREHTLAGAGAGAFVGLVAGLVTAWPAGLVLGAATAGAGVAWLAARNGALANPREPDTTELTEDEEPTDA